MAACLMLAGCGSTPETSTAQAQQSSAAPEETTVTTVPLPDYVTKDVQSCGDLTVSSFNELLFAPEVTAGELAKKLPDFTIHSNFSTGYTASLPVTWGEHKFTLGMTFDKEYKFVTWETTADTLTPPILKDALGSTSGSYILKNKKGKENLSDEPQTYVYEWSAPGGMYLFYKYNQHSLRYSGKQMISGNEPVKEDTGKIMKLKCGMTYDEVIAMVGEPCEEKKEGNIYRLSTWRFDSIASLTALVGDIAQTDELVPAEFVCQFYKDLLYGGDYIIYGLGDTADKVSEKIVSLYQSTKENANKEWSHKSDRSNEYWKVDLVKTFNGELWLLNFDATDRDSMGYKISFQNYKYYVKTPDSGEDKSDGKVGDNDGNGVIDEKDWEEEWKNFLNGKLNGN